MRALQRVVVILVVFAIACDAAAKDIPVAGPLALDTAAAVLRLAPAYRHTGAPTTLCVVVDSVHYDLRDIRHWTVHELQPAEARSGMRLDTTPDPNAIALSATATTSSGKRLALQALGYTYGVDQRVCLGAGEFAKGDLVTAIELRASHPFKAQGVAWNVVYR
jgi:hypothetical protein